MTKSLIPEQGKHETPSGNLPDEASISESELGPFQKFSVLAAIAREYVGDERAALVISAALLNAVEDTEWPYGVYKIFRGESQGEDVFSFSLSPFSSPDFPPILVPCDFLNWGFVNEIPILGDERGSIHPKEEMTVPKIRSVGEKKRQQYASETYRIIAQLSSGGSLEDVIRRVYNPRRFPKEVEALIDFVRECGEAMNEEHGIEDMARKKPDDSRLKRLKAFYMGTDE